MNKKRTLIIGVVIILLGYGGYFAYCYNKIGSFTAITPKEDLSLTERLAAKVYGVEFYTKQELIDKGLIKGEKSEKQKEIDTEKEYSKTHVEETTELENKKREEAQAKETINLLATPFDEYLWYEDYLNNDLLYRKVTFEGEVIKKIVTDSDVINCYKVIYNTEDNTELIFIIQTVDELNIGDYIETEGTVFYDSYNIGIPVIMVGKVNNK